eukprot:1146086-Heterocapsa_arctica.AAC.1
MAGQVLLPPVPGIARLGLQHLHMRQDIFLGFLYVRAELLPVDVVLPLPDRRAGSLCRRICEGVSPVVPNA